MSRQVSPLIELSQMKTEINIFSSRDNLIVRGSQRKPEARGGEEDSYISSGSVGLANTSSYKALVAAAYAASSCLHVEAMSNILSIARRQTLPITLPYEEAAW